MSEKIKMTDGELLEIRNLQEKFQQKVFYLGQLSLQKIQINSTLKNLNEQEIKIESDWLDLQKEENQLICCKEGLQIVCNVAYHFWHRLLTEISSYWYFF